MSPEWLVVNGWPAFIWRNRQAQIAYRTHGTNCAARQSLGGMHNISQKASAR